MSKKTVGDLIARLLDKKGVDLTDAKYKEILAIGVEAPNDVYDSLDTLITEDYALNSSKIKTHFVGNFVTGTKKNLEDLLKAAGLPEETVDDIFTEKTFSNLLPKAMKAFGDHVKGDPKAGKEDPSLKQEIENLRKQLSDKDKTHADALAQKESDFEGERLQNLIDTEFSSRSWSEQYPEHLRTTLGRESLKQALNDKGATIVRDKETKQLKIVQTKNNELDYFDSSNKKVTYKQFVDEIFSTNKFSAVSQATDDPAAQETITTASSQAKQRLTQQQNPTLSKLDQALKDQEQNASIG